MVNFEYLNTELLFEIFDYLSFTDLFRAFFNLQQRIDNAIRVYPACIDLSKTIDRQALVHGPFLCRALVVADDDSEENQLDRLPLNYEAIRAIDCRYVNAVKLQSFLKRLPIKQLHSIALENFDRRDAPKDIDQQIWSTVAVAGQNRLRHLHTSLPIIRSDVDQLLFDLPSLQCVTFEYISVEEILTFVRHTPNLRSLTGRVIDWNIDSHPSRFSIPTFNYLDLHVQGCGSFEELRQLLSVCPYLTHLTLRFWISSYNVSMVNAIAWQMLIEECLPDLIYLKIRLFRWTCIGFDPEPILDLSDYWLSRQSQFDIAVRSLRLICLEYFSHNESNNAEQRADIELKE